MNREFMIRLFMTKSLQLTNTSSGMKAVDDVH